MIPPNRTGTRVLLKIGGAQLEHPDARAALCQAIAAAREDGVEVVVVHGGGNQIRELSGRLGIQDRYHEGLRITDAATADVALMVLGGLVNRTLVAELQAAGVRAVGLTGADGGLFGAGRHTPTDETGAAVDLGFVGHVQTMDSEIAEHLLEGDYVPVIASVAPLADEAEGSREHFYNINADTAAAPLALVARCSHLIFLTDVPGVRGPDGTVVSELDAVTCERWIEDGTVHGGMIPKVRAALAARIATRDAASPPVIKIADASAADAVRRALQPGSGTAFRA